MQLDPVRVVDTRAWLSKAAQDLRRVEILLAADPPDPEGSLFHSQQAAEEALKAFLTWHDVPFRRVHDLDEIGKQCAGLDPTLAGIVERADELTKYAWRFRYPARRSNLHSMKLPRHYFSLANSGRLLPTGYQLKPIPEFG